MFNRKTDKSNAFLDIQGVPWNRSPGLGRDVDENVSKMGSAKEFKTSILEVPMARWLALRATANISGDYVFGWIRTKPEFTILFVSRHLIREAGGIHRLHQYLFLRDKRKD